MARRCCSYNATTNDKQCEYNNRHITVQSLNLASWHHVGVSEEQHARHETRNAEGQRNRLDIVLGGSLENQNKKTYRRHEAGTPCGERPSAENRQRSEPCSTVTWFVLNVFPDFAREHEAEKNRR